MTARDSFLRGRTRLPYAAALLALCALGACTSSGAAGEPATSSAAATPAATTTASSATTTSAAPSPTTSADPVIAKFPAAARGETQKAAAAFSQFYFEQLNRSFKKASPELLEGLYDASCRICVDLHESAQQLKASKQHHEGDTLKVTFSSATVFNKRDRQVLVRLQQYAVPVLDSHGKSVDTTKAGSGAFVAVLTYRGHWVITDLGRPS